MVLWLHTSETSRLLCSKACQTSRPQSTIRRVNETELPEEPGIECENTTLGSNIATNCEHARPWLAVAKDKTLYSMFEGLVRSRWDWSVEGCKKQSGGDIVDRGKPLRRVDSLRIAFKECGVKHFNP